MRINGAVIKRNDAGPLPFEQRCVVKLHREDEGVVKNVFSWRSVDFYFDRTSCASLYHKSETRVKGLVSQLYRSFRMGEEAPSGISHVASRRLSRDLCP